MGALAQGAKNVAAIELRGGKKIERGGEEPDPGGAADRMQEKIAGVRAVAKQRCEKLKQEWSAEDEFVVGGNGQSGNEFGVQYAVDERGDGDDKADERAGGADVEERAVGTNGRTDENKGAQRADKRWERDEERIAGTDVMMAAGEEVAEFVSEKNGEQREGEGQAGGESHWLAIGQREGAHKVVPGNGLVVSVGHSEVRAGDETRAQGEEEEGAGE